MVEMTHSPTKEMTWWYIRQGYIISVVPDGESLSTLFELCVLSAAPY